MAKCPFAIWKPISGAVGPYVGGPFKIVHHTTEGSSANGAFNAFRTNGSDPHFTVDSTTIYQHIDTDMAARALRNNQGGVQTNKDSAIQIEVVGFAGRTKSRATLENVAKLCRWIEKTHGVPKVWPNGFPKPAVGGQDPGGHNRNAANWDTKGGHYGHCHVPENIHWDPAYTANEVNLLMGLEFETGEVMMPAKLAEVFASTPESEPELDGMESTMPDHAIVDGVVDSAGSSEALTSPGGPHTPVNNFTAEAIAEFEELSEPAFAGDLGDDSDPINNDEESVAVIPRGGVARESLVEAEISWTVPDTSELEDIGVASFGSPLSRAETVHGPDSRIRIVDTATFPWRVHASLLITARDNSRWIGTAWFISPRTLVTAGHCVYIKNSGKPERDGWVKNIQVMPGRNADNLPFGAVTATQFWSVKGWIESGDENFDYAAIIIPAELGKKTGWLGIATLSDASLQTAKANIAGYPGDKDTGTLWYDKQVIASVNPNKVFYDIDTAGGQSGAAVYVIQEEIQDGKPKVERKAVAVHAYGGATTNSGTRISPPVYTNLVNWKA